MDTLATIIQFAKDFNGGRTPLPYPRMGIDFYMVGHNASHQFSLGLDTDGQVWKMACGEGPDDQDGVPTLDITLHRVTTDDLGYIGHW